MNGWTLDCWPGIAAWAVRKAGRTAAGSAVRIAVRAAATASALAIVAAANTGAIRADPLPDAEWRRLADGPDRALHAMIYDESNDLFWTFGGVEVDPTSNATRNTVYRLDAADPQARWQLASIGGLRPPPTQLHSAVYDPVRQRMLVYGGIADRQSDGAQAADPRSVWALELADPAAPSWTRVSFTGGVGERFAHAAAYVPGYDAMVVTGGLSAPDRARDDSFALLLAENPPRYVRLANAGFGRRGGHVLLVDEPEGRLLAYGGLSSLARVSTTNEVVALDISSALDGADRWLRLSTTTPGTSRALMAAAFDPQRRLWWVQGGIQANNSFLRELSVLDLGGDGATWVRTGLVYNGPLDRFGHAAAWDTGRARAVFHGGTPNQRATMSDTRALAIPSSATPDTGPTGSVPTAAPTTPGGTATSGSPTASSTPTDTPPAIETPPATPSTGTATVSPSPGGDPGPSPNATATGEAPSPPPTASGPNGGHRLLLPWASAS